jgi:hypothetical protein
MENLDTMARTVDKIANYLYNDIEDKNLTKPD